MNLNQTFSILFRLNHSKKNSKGLIPIWVRITVDGRRTEFSTSKQIHLEHWDVELYRANKDCPDAKIINDYIDATQTEIKRHYNILLTTKDYVTAEDVKNSCKGVKEKAIMFIEVFKEYNQTLLERKEKKDLSEGRYKKFPTLLEKFQNFLNHKYKKTDIPVKELRLLHINEFYHYVRTVGGIEQNTAMKNAKDLKQVLDYVVMLEYLPSNPFDYFKCSFKKTRRVKLSNQEIETIYKKEIRNPRLVEVRDCYVFAIHTGYAYKQLEELEPDNVQFGIDGRKWIIKDRSKADSDENVPLLPVALEIIEKYKDHPYCKARNKLLPVNSNQRYNEYLKEIAAICDIDKNLTTHIARHTFATTITLENGVPLETVSKLLGHNDIRSTQIYAEITETRVSEDTLDLDEKIEKRKSKLKMKLVNAS